MSTSREQMDRMRYEAEQAEAKLKEQGKETESTARQTMYRTSEGAESAKHNLASGLHSAAGRVRGESFQRGQPGLASRFAEPLDRSAQYLDQHSLPQIREDAGNYAREHPFVAAAGVFTAAFLLGRLLRRR